MLFLITQIELLKLCCSLIKEKLWPTFGCEDRKACAVMISQSRRIMVLDISMSIDGFVCQDKCFELDPSRDWKLVV